MSQYQFNKVNLSSDGTNNGTKANLKRGGKKVFFNGFVVDPSQNICEIGSVVVNGGRITRVECGSKSVKDFDVNEYQLIDCTGKNIVPGFIDIHCHLREPGFEYKETIASGTMAAAKGGITTTLAMANTKPVNDTRETTEWLQKKIRDDSHIRVLLVGAITKGLQSKELADLEGMAEAGIVALSDDGFSVRDMELYAKAMQFAAKNDLLITAHCEDLELVKHGVANTGFANRHGLKGISNESEAVIIERDIQLAKRYNARLHICHLSVREGLEIIKRQRKNFPQLQLTCEVSPHHLLLNDEDIDFQDKNYKMNPPLRSILDQLALVQGLRENEIDCIATDHAPHSVEEKKRPWDIAPFGIIGFESSFPLCYSLVEKQLITISDLVKKYTVDPARILKLSDRGNFKRGSLADIVVFNFESEQIGADSFFVSKSRNSPFVGWNTSATILETYVNGDLVFLRKE